MLVKIFDLHDKLSEAIHAISRSHFLNSFTNRSRNLRTKSADDYRRQKSGNGFVFAKEFLVDDDDESAVEEAKSLYSIRTALENLEEQLEFFNTVQMQQRAERDTAIARLEQSRIVLAMRLAEHHGKKYKVIEEAHALVGDLQDASLFAAPEHPYNSIAYPSGENFVLQKDKRPNALVNFFLSSLTLVSKSPKLDRIVGILGNASLVMIGMFAFVHMNQVGCKENYTFDLSRMQDPSAFTSEMRGNSHMKGLSSDRITELDVTLARG